MPDIAAILRRGARNENPLDIWRKRGDTIREETPDVQECACHKCHKVLFEAAKGSYVKKECPRCKLLNIFDLRDISGS